MDWATIIQIAGIIGTAIGILLVYSTLREMRNQRKAAQKPDLIIPGFKLHAYGDIAEYENERVEILFFSNKVKAKKHEDVFTDAQFKFYNVGFGAAKNIEFEWTVDYDKTLQTMRDYCYQNSIPIVIQVDKDAEYEDLVITDRGFKKHYFLEPATDTFDYLMPVSITSEGVEAKLPHTAADIISFVMYLRSHYWKHYPEEYHKSPNIEFPPIKLDVHYDDVEDFHYSKGFDLEWGFYAANGKILDEPINDLTWLWDASLEFKSRNKRTPQK